MPVTTFIVVFAKGLEDLLIQELKSLGIENPKLTRFVIEFEGTLQQAYKVCLYSRLASRILMPVLTADADGEDELYKVIQTINWDDHIPLDGSFAIDAVIKSSTMTNSHYTALKVKDAIVKISEGRLGTVLVTDEQNRLLALVSDGDIRRALLSEDFSLEDSVDKYATHNPRTLDDENILASEALVTIEEMKIQLLVVTDKQRKVKGVLHIHTLIEKGIS